MSAGNYIRIPSDNTNRNDSELRATIDQIHSAYVRMEAIRKKMAEIGGTPNTPANIEQEYNLNPGEGTDVQSLVASAVGELDAAPFFQQLISRLG